jgi:hypothetical protein
VNAALTFAPLSPAFIPDKQPFSFARVERRTAPGD